MEAKMEAHNNARSTATTITFHNTHFRLYYLMQACSQVITVSKDQFPQLLQGKCTFYHTRGMRLEETTVSEITKQGALSKQLKSDPFLNSALQRFTCEL